MCQFEYPEERGGCSSAGVLAAGVAAANLLSVVAPLGIIGGVKGGRKRATK